MIGVVFGGFVSLGFAKIAVLKYRIIHMRTFGLFVMFFCGVCVVFFAGCKKEEPVAVEKPKPPPFIAPEPVAPVETPAVVRHEEKPAVEMSMEDEYQAGKLLAWAQTMMQIGTKYTTPKAAIETCRQLIKDYPGTKYEQEARMLLRMVPAKDHKRYKITSEEMGL